MSNLFFRTTLAPYRIDFYNFIYKHLDMKLFFYRRKDLTQDVNMDELENKCSFMPHYLNGFEIKKGSRKICFGINNIIKSNNPQIIIVPEYQILVLQVIIYKYLFNKKFKIISMCDDSYDMIINDNNFTKIHKYARFILTPLLDNIIVIEPRVKDWYQKKYGKGLWFPIIRDEVNERKEYEMILPLSNSINEEYGLIGKKVILYVGRLTKIKNVSSLLSAYEKIGEDCVLVIIGSGEEEETLKRQASKINKKIIFTGRLEPTELRAWYNISDIFVLLSTKEPFGAVTNEALIAGNYVVISENAGSSCLVEEGFNGYIVNPNDIEKVTISIDNLLTKIKNKNEFIKLKPNLMNVFFNEQMNNLLSKL